MARKIKWAEPHFEFWWQAPLTVKNSATAADEPADRRQDRSLAFEHLLQRDGCPIGADDPENAEASHGIDRADLLYVQRAVAEAFAVEQRWSL